MIAWCGSSSEGLSWLRERCSSVDRLLNEEAFSIPALETLCQQHPRRLILAVDSRLNYPFEEIQHLRLMWPEIPWALAVGSWFDGSRRTGIGTASHLSLPWYRWWDGWNPWLSRSNAEFLNPWPRALPTNGLRLSASSSANDDQGPVSGNLTGVIISNCTQSGEAWKAAFESDVAGPNTAAAIQSLTLSQFQSQLEHAAHAAPDWILWDDSCLNTFTGATCMHDACILFAAIRKHYPSVLLIAATSMPRWADWQAWSESGANELLAKPHCGARLGDVLATA